MAVLSCTLDYESGCDASYDDRNLGSYKVRWIIKSDVKHGPRTAANLALVVGPNPLPNLWSTYAYLDDTDDTSFLRQIDVNRYDESRLLYEAIGSYRPNDPGEDSGSSGGGGGDIANPDPLLRPVVWQGDGEVYTSLVEKDKDGAAVINAAGKPFDPGLEREETRCVATATKNYASLSGVFALMQFIGNSVNDKTWQGMAPRTVLCKEVRPQPLVTEGNVSFYPVSFRFVLRELGKTWDDELLEQGGGALTTPNDFASYEPSEDIVLLNSDGTERDPAGGGVYKTWRTYREVDFAAALGF